MHSIYYFANINECETGKHHCDSNAFCKNTKGAYICTCKPGYNGNGVNCVSKAKCTIIFFLKLLSAITAAAVTVPRFLS